MLTTQGVGPPEREAHAQPNSSRTTLVADRFMHSETAIIAVMAGVTAAVTFGVGLWDRWRSNVEKLTLHNIIRDLSGGVIQ